MLKPQRVTVPMFEVVSNPIIAKGPSADWFRQFYEKDSYLRCKGALTSFTNIKEVQNYILDTAPYMAHILRKVVADHFPQYTDLTDKIIMLQ